MADLVCTAIFYMSALGGTRRRDCPLASVMLARGATVYACTPAGPACKITGSSVLTSMSKLDQGDVDETGSDANLLVHVAGQMNPTQENPDERFINLLKVLQKFQEAVYEAVCDIAALLNGFSQRLEVVTGEYLEIMEMHSILIAKLRSPEDMVEDGDFDNQIVHDVIPCSRLNLVPIDECEMLPIQRT